MGNNLPRLFEKVVALAYKARDAFAHADRAQARLERSPTSARRLRADKAYDRAAAIQSKYLDAVEAMRAALRAVS